MNFRIITAYVTSLLCSGLFAQSVPRAQPMPTFHIQGTVSSPWDSLLRGQAIPRSSVTFSGEQAIRNLGSNDKDSYISVPNTEITFRGEQATKTVTVDDKGFYQADLPVGLYKMTAHGPTIHTQPLTEYVRLFRVQSPTTIVLNGSLHMARTNCDVVANSDTPELHTEELGGYYSGTAPPTIACNTTATSNQLNCSGGVNDFLIGHGVAIPTAGVAPTMLAPGAPFPISSISVASNVATATLANNASFAPGSNVVIAGSSETLCLQRHIPCGQPGEFAQLHL